MCVLTADRQCFPPDQDGCHFDFRNSDWLICENDIISTARIPKKSPQVTGKDRLQVGGFYLWALSLWQIDTTIKFFSLCSG